MAEKSANQSLAAMAYGNELWKIDEEDQKHLENQIRGRNDAEIAFIRNKMGASGIVPTEEEVNRRFLLSRNF